MATTAVVVPSWLDREFAESCLRASSSYEDMEITSVDVHRATAPGDNFMSEIYRMSVQLGHSVKQYKKTLSLIVKCLPNSEVMQKLTKDMEVFERETLMYCETIPAMSQILEDAAPGKYTQLSAKCFASGKQPINYLVLEDLKARGFALASKSKGLDLAHAKLVVRKLAEFHGSSVALHERNPVAMDKYMVFRVFEGPGAKNIESYITQGCKLLADQLEMSEESYSRYAPKLRALSENIFPRLVEMANREDRFRVLNHADTWVNNIMFQHSDGVVQNVVLLDFQISAFNSPSIDLQYFLHTSLTEQVYTDHFTDLLKEYHEHLVEVLSDIGVSEDKQVSFEELLEDFQSHALHAVYSAVVELPLLRTDEEASCFAFEASLSGEATDNNRSAYAGESYMRIIKRILPQLEKWGVL